MSRPPSDPVVPFGDRALLVEVPDAESAAALALWLRQHPDLPDSVVDVVPAARSVLVDGTAERDVLRGLFTAWPGPGRRGRAGRVEIPVRYDGPDLGTVARVWGCDEAEVVRRHTSWDFVATFSGFAPGFSYLAGVPGRYRLPRLPTPRPRVDPGSVGMADTWCGIYPTASPGGWLLVGTTDVVLWDPDSPTPALLPPGTSVRFREVR